MKTGELSGMEKRNRRAAAGRKGFHRVAEDGKGSQRMKNKRHIGNRRRDFNGRCVYLPMREMRNRTLMTRLAGIRVPSLMQCWRRGQHVEQENDDH